MITREQYDNATAAAGEMKMGTVEGGTADTAQVQSPLGSGFGLDIDGLAKGITENWNHV